MRGHFLNKITASRHCIKQYYALFTALLLLNLTPALHAGTFTTLPNSPITARTQHTATVLQNGQILVAGGKNASGTALSSVELFDPATGLWSSAGTFTARFGHTATVLPNGTVLLAGGTSDGTHGLSVCELYDPASGTVTATTSMIWTRFGHTATLVATSSTVFKVLVTGGIDSSAAYTNRCDLYTPTSATTGTWVAATALSAVRAYHTATLLPNGKVFLAGGKTSATSYLTNTVLYTPAATGGGTWANGTVLATARADHTATLMANGSVLVAGGDTTGGSFLSSAAVYTPNATTGTWASSTPSMSAARAHHAACLLTNGSVLVMGGVNSGGVVGGWELFDSLTPGSWSSGSLGTARQYATANILAGGKALLTGGTGSSGVVGSAELFDVSTSAASWSVSSSSPYVRYHTSTLLGNGKVLVAGGLGPLMTASSTSGTWLYDSTGWWPAVVMNAGRQDHTATLLTSGKVLVVGGDAFGSGISTYSTTAEIFDPGSGTPTGGNWTLTATSPNGVREGHSATLLSDGTVLIAGGFNASGPLTGAQSAQLYDPANPSSPWSNTTGSMNTGRQGHTATLLPNGQVLVWGGIYTISTPGYLGELYDPVSKTWTGFDTVSYYVVTGHTATLLPNGKVLIAGGWGGSTLSLGLFTNSQLYDPATGTFTSTNALNVPRMYHTATLLASGQVLIAGGEDSTGATIYSSAELYDPATGNWTLTASLPNPITGDVATLLPSGQVLAAGGANTTLSVSSSVFDPGLGASSLPVIGSSVPSTLTLSTSFTIASASGSSNLTGPSEASGGDNQSSASNYPLVQFHSLDNEQTSFFTPSNASNWSSTTFTSVAVPKLPLGYGMLTVFAGGRPSTSKLVQILSGKPMLAAPTSTGVTISSTSLASSVTSDGASPITARGFVYCTAATSHTPTIGLTGVTNLTSGGTTGSFSATAISLTAGTTYYYAAYATNANGTSYSSYSTFVPLTCTTITVNNPTSVPNGYMGGYYSAQFGQTGGVGSVVYSLPTGVTLPSGLSLSSSGLISGVAGSGTAGSHSVTVKVTDSRLCTATSASFAIVINNSTCPTLTMGLADPYQPNWLLANSPQQQTFTVSGAVGSVVFSVSSGTLPPGLTLGTYSGVLSGTPGAAGAYPVTIQAMDSHGCLATYSYPLSVAAPNMTAQMGTTGIVGAYGYGTLSVPGMGDSDYATYSVSGTLPAGVTFDGVWAFNGTPTSPGSFPITVTATDSYGYSQNTSITLIAACPTVVVTNPSVATGQAGTAFTGQFTQSAAPSNFTTGSFSVTSGTLPTGLSLDSSTGILSGIPTQAGSFTVTVTYTDPSGCTGASSYTLVLSGDNAKLANMTLSSLTLSPTFDPLYNGGYTASIPSGPTSITVTPTAQDPNATIQVSLNGGTFTTVATGTASSGMTVQNPGDYVTVQVTSEDATVTRNYTIVLSANGFAPGTSMNGTCASGTAVVYGNGKVSMLGTSDGVNVENYNPITATWVTAYTWPASNYAPGVTVTPWGSNRALAFGGYDSAMWQYSYTPVSPYFIAGSTNIYSYTPYTAYFNSFYATASLLSGNKFLIAGGLVYPVPNDPGVALNDAEIYDADSNQFTSIASMINARAYHTANVVVDGGGATKVFVTGGADDYSTLNSSELYDPTLGTWSSAASSTYAHSRHTSTQFPDGKVLVTGGDSYSASTEIYDPATDSWTIVGDLNVGRLNHTATLVTNGSGKSFVLVVGGENASGPLASAELFDPTAGTWTAIGNLTTPRTVHTASLVTDGTGLTQVMVAGGMGTSAALSSTEMFNINLVVP